MKEQIIDIQKAILKQIFEWSFNHKEISFIDFPIFGRFQRIFDTLRKIPDDEFKKDWYIHTDFAKLGDNKQIVEIMTCDYYSPNPYKDIEYLTKQNLLGKEMEIDVSIDAFKKLEKIRLELYKKMSGWESKNYAVDNVLNDAYKLSLQAKNKTWILGYSTGLKTLDKYTDWLQKGTVMRLTAYSNIWKSKLSYHICNSVLDQWAKVLYFSLEVKKEFVFYNLLCNRYWLVFGDVARGCWHDDDITKIQEADIEIIDDKYKLEEILLYSESRKPDVIFIDFVQNIQTEWKSEYESMTKIATSIQQLAIRNNIAVFDLSQISNDWAWYEFGWVIKSKWSGALVASADIGLVMQRDKENNHNIVYIAKNKFWTNTKAIDLKFNFPTGEIEDLGEHLTKSLQI